MLVNYVIKNRFYDSVLLMQIANEVKSVLGLEKVSVMMGTEPNKALMSETGVLEPSTEAGANDLIIAFAFEGEDRSEEALEYVREKLDKRDISVKKGGELELHSINAALAVNPDTNLLFLSLPGPFVKYEALKGIKSGLNVMIFSDNVSVEDELELKELASSNSLLVMGPDCGTSIIAGKALGFANVVELGSVGIAGASGTGIQEMTVLLNAKGIGISHAIGTGGRDLSREIGGITMLTAVKALAEDDGTDLLVVLSKPPAPEVAEKVVALCNTIEKRSVVCFIGNKSTFKTAPHVHMTSNIEEAVIKIYSLQKGTSIENPLFDSDISLIRETASRAFVPLKEEQKYIRALYSGGTLCEEALAIVSNLIGEVYSNTSLYPGFILEEPDKSREHTFVDMGDDTFTRGMPHPMIDYTLRKERLKREMSDPETAVILFDLVLGYGSHPDPAGELLPVISEMRTELSSQGRSCVLVAYVCGTDGDPQGYERQKRRLEEAGVIVMPSNPQAARFASLVVSRGNISF